MWRCVLFVALALVPGGGSAFSAEPATGDVEFFEQRVRPVLAQKCWSCHGAQKQRGGLRLDRREAIVKGGDTGPSVIPGKPEESLLVRAVRHDGEIKMPPKAQLAAGEVEALAAWVRLGAPWPAGASGPVASTVAEARKRHWAFQPVRKPTVPAVRSAGWACTPVDRFILARLEEKGLAPAPPAQRRTLLRRLSFDLVGLPPSPEDVEAFVADSSPDAWSKVVDRLLASPQYGERWGRHWLDVARYADTRGYVFTQERKFPFSWTYRDYVIRSFNEDLPYDQFLLHQLAADQLPLGEDKRPLAAMGFLTLGRRFLENKPDIIDDRIDVTMRGLQGLTVSCARCHDHKFDPIPIRDYYSLYGIFDSSIEPKDLPALQGPGVVGTQRAMVLADAPSPVTPHVFVRGNPNNPGPAVPRQFIEVLASEGRKPFTRGSGRLELARAIASKDNPLTARVIVNRIWQHHFGQGLVRTPGDFGTRGEPPTHPELLDWLAATFVEEGWSVKKLHRLILSSAVYRQASVANPQTVANDPENRLLGRMNRRRLELEPLRDALLAVAGALEARVGGPGEDILQAPLSRRRTIYGFIDRQNLPGLFRTFDLASPDSSTSRRHETTVPQQALFLLNGPFVHEQARRFAARVDVAGLPDEARVRRMYAVAYGRPPDADELADGLAFVRTTAAAPNGRLGAWEQYAQVLLLANELALVD